jgi:ubiquinone/menaquinone biosynthesis C-methylase UbiE
MSSDKRFLLSKIRPGSGWAVDLGGGSGGLDWPLEQRGYRYLNVDVAPSGRGRRVVADAHRLPFRDDTIDLVISSDSLEHFHDPARALVEARRVLTPMGTFLVWVPFMHPFHLNDYFRFTPLGLRHLFARGGFRILSLEAPVWIFTILGQMIVTAMQRLRLSAFEKEIEALAAWLDQRLSRFQGKDLGFAAAYLIVAKPDEPQAGPAHGT